MKAKASLGDLLWMAAGAAVVLALMLVLLYMRKGHDPAAELAFKARRVELVGLMRLALSSASEAEKSAVMATTDQESVDFADQSRSRMAAVERGRQELAGLLQNGGTKAEQDLLAQFTRAFAEFQRVDANLLDLAVQNTNLKAFGLAFGPAAEAINEMDAALARVAAQDVNSISPNAGRILQLADDARIAALRIQTLLPPHIAEESDRRMDELEAQMSKEDTRVHKDLDDLAALLKPAGNRDLETASARYAKFSEIRTQIIKLSRENTNVRSLTISLGRKREAVSLCQDDLAALEQAIQQEPIAGVTYGTPVHPR